MQDNSKTSRARRRTEAAARQQERDSLTPQQQLDLLAARPGDSAKETLRLSALLS